MTLQEMDEYAAEYGFDLAEDTTNEQAVFALKNLNYLKHLMMGAKHNETLRNNE